MQKKIVVPKEVEFLLSRLYKAGHRAYIVGGAIRDWLCEREITDWDITTSAPSDVIKEIFQDRTIFSLKHDTVTIVLRGKNYEITPFRGTDLLDDLMHRDFTINAMAYDPKEDLVIDPVDGRSDLKKRIIRATLDPYARFMEDPLRMLRAIRFSVELGFRIEKKTRDAIADMSSFIKDVSEERIRDELLKLLISPLPSRGIRLMLELGLMKYILPELVEGYGMRQNRYHRYTVFNHTLLTIYNIGPEPLLRLSALFHDIGKPRTKKKIKGKVAFYGHEEKGAYITKDIMRRLKFSNELIGKVYILVKEHMIQYRPEWKDSAIRRFINRVGKDLVNPLISLRRADLIAHGTEKSDELQLLDELQDRVQRQMEKGAVFSLKDLRIDGHMIMNELGISEGPKVGRILKALYEKVLEDPELNRTDTLISIAREIKDSL